MGDPVGTGLSSRKPTSLWELSFQLMLLESEWLFGDEKLRALYGSVANYQPVAGQTLRRQIEAGFLLPCNAEALRREIVERVVL